MDRKVLRAGLGVWMVLAVLELFGCASTPSSATDLGNDGGTPDDLGLDAGGGDQGSDVGTCACDDGIACTVDFCAVNGTCQHVLDHAQCSGGQVCHPTDGCSNSMVCSGDENCTQLDPCLIPSCDPALRVCVYARLDGDEDGEPPLVCQGNDCNDGDGAIRPGVTDTCDGVNNDCDGAIDEDGTASCEALESCVEGACTCANPNRECGGQCVDITQEVRHCGGCNRNCGVGEECADSSCACGSGRTECVHGCFDLMVDRSACGACDAQCGLGASCEEGSCTCFNPSRTRCEESALIFTDDGDPLPARSYRCADMTMDTAHCGGCGISCLATSRCDSSECELRATWVKAFSGAEDNLLTYARGLVRDTSGNLIVLGNVRGAGGVFDHDSLNAPLATTTGSAGVVVKLGPDGTPLWAQPLWQDARSSVLTVDLQGDVWVGGQFVTSTIVDGQAIAPADGTSGRHGILVKLSGANGSLLWHRVFQGNGDINTQSSIRALATNASGQIVVAGVLNPARDIGSGSPVGGVLDGFVLRMDPDGTHRQSYTVEGNPLFMDLRGGMLPVIAAEFFGTVTVAGVQLTASAGGNQLIAAYDATGTATNAFGLGNLYHMAAIDGDVIVHRPYSVYRYSLDGVSRWHSASDSTHTNTRVAVAGGRLFVVGNYVARPGLWLLGWYPQAGNVFITELDPADGSNLRMGTFSSLGETPSILGLVASTDRVWVAASHDDTVSVPGFAVPSRQAKGMAVVEALLPVP